MKRVVLLFAFAACSDPPPPRSPAFELDCDAADTATASQLHCVRTDTRTGEVLVIDHLRLPISNGPTTADARDTGAFTTACAATSTDRRADFYCIRMSTRTGELLLVNLQKVGALPRRP